MSGILESSGESRNEVVFVLGGPGSGKGTLCSKIQDEFAYVHLSAGDLLRAERRDSGPTSELINRIINEGGIVPAEITVKLLAQAMKSSRATKFLIDGFPRNYSNLLIWYNLMSNSTFVPFVLNLDLNEDDMLKRLLERGKSSGRLDDNAETIKKRFQTFYSDTMPVLDTFRMGGKLRTISSLPPPDAVYRHAAKLFRSLHILPPYQRTFALIKPDALKNGNCQAILAAITVAKLVVVEMKLIMMTVESTRGFYAEHAERDFFPDLLHFMTSGPAVAIILEGTDAVKVWRNAMGPTSPVVARVQSPSSIRALYGTDNTRNACHGSDSEQSALRGIKYWMDPDAESAGMKCSTGTITPTGTIVINDENESGFYFEEKVSCALRPGSVEDTFAMIKPIAASNYADEIISVILGHGFEIAEQVNTTLTLEKAELFYAEHSSKGFFKYLTEYMSSGPIVALHLRRVAAVAAWRHLIGPTNVSIAAESRPDTLRAKFGLDGTRNATHGSDSSLSAKREIEFFFSFGNTYRSGGTSLTPSRPNRPLAPIRLVPKQNIPNVAVMSRSDFATMQTYADHEVDPIIRKLLHQLMINRPSDVAGFAIKELTNMKNNGGDIQNSNVPLSLPAIRVTPSADVRASFTEEDD